MYGPPSPLCRLQDRRPLSMPSDQRIAAPECLYANIIIPVGMFQSTPPRRGRLYIFFPLFLSYFTTYFPRTLILCICFVSICYILTKDMLILCNIKRIADLLEFFRLLKVREASPFEAYYRISGPSGS